MDQQQGHDPPANVDLSASPLEATLAERLCRVAAECAYVQKDGNNAFHKYKFASAAAVSAHVNPACTRNGVAVLSTNPTIVSVEGTGKERLVTVRMEITVGCATDSARATFAGLGSGMDAGDKAVMKATTAATKYAWMTGLSIATGDDPEADEETDKRTSGTKARGTDGRGPNPSEPRGPARRPAATTPAEETTQESSQPDPTNMHPVLGGFYARLTEIELPGESVAVWMKFRAELAPLPVGDREAAWRALCKRTEEVGRMKNAKVWLKKAIQEQDNLRGSTGGAADGQAA